MIIRTPGYPLGAAPNANAFAECWIRSVREAWLDKLLILNQRHLEQVLTAYLDYYNHARLHQGLEQRCPVPFVRNAARDGPIERRDILGGVLHDYERRAA
jgi:transposase InsO family protein